jgi:hypothetical protein
MVLCRCLLEGNINNYGHSVRTFGVVPEIQTAVLLNVSSVRDLTDVMCGIRVAGLVLWHNLTIS